MNLNVVFQYDKGQVLSELKKITEKTNFTDIELLTFLANNMEAGESINKELDNYLWNTFINQIESKKDELSKVLSKNILLEIGEEIAKDLLK